MGLTHTITSPPRKPAPREPTLVVSRAKQPPGRALGPGLATRSPGAVSRRAKVFFGSDTGPLHLAAAVGTPCVGLYGPWPSEVHGPFGPQHIALQKARFTGSTRQRRTAPAALMEAITVADVCQACDRILQVAGNHPVGAKQA